MIEEVSSQGKVEEVWILIGIIVFVFALIDETKDTPKGRVIIKGIFFLVGIVIIGLFANYIIKTI